MNNSRRGALRRRPTKRRPLRGSYAKPVGEVLEGRRLLAADFEPNDTFGSAVNLGSGNQLHTDPTINPGGDIDWYKWRASTSGTVRVDLLFDQDNLDAVLRLFNASGVPLVTADTATDNERASFSVTANQEIYIQVSEFTGTDIGSYDLQIREVGPDKFETGGLSNNTRATATVLSSQDQVHTDLTLHRSTDDDYYRWTAGFEGILTVDLSFSHDDGDAQLIVSDINGEIDSSQSGTDNERVSVHVTAGQVIYIHVFEGLNLELLGYDLSVQFGSPPTISNTPFINSFFDAPTTVNITVGDADTPLNSLILTATSSHQGIVRDSGLVFGGSGANRTLTINPTGSFGRTTITVTVNDNDGGIAEDEFLFAAFLSQPNDRPTISFIADQTIDEDSSTGPIPFTISDTESIASALTVTVGSSDTELIPIANIVIGGSGSNRTVNVTPKPNRAGTATVTITVKDPEGAAATQIFLVTVNQVDDPGVNDPPGFDPIASQNVEEDSGSHFVTITGINPGGGQEEAGQTVTLTAISSDPSLIPNPSFNGNTLVYAPAPNRFGSATITVTATDSGPSGGNNVNQFSRSFNVTVTPVNDQPTISAIANLSAKAGQLSDPTVVTVGDLETPPSLLVLTATSSNIKVVPNSNITISTGGAQRNIFVTPLSGGSTTITVTVRDTNSGTSQSSFNVFVTSANTPPSFTLTKSADIVTEDAGPQIRTGWATNISPGSANETGQNLTFNLTNTNPKLFTVAPAISTNGTLTYRPAPNASGSATIKVELVDDGGGETNISASQNFTITVTAVNDPPSFIRGPDQNPTVPGPQTVPGWATQINAGPTSDEQSQTLTFKVVSNTNPGMFSVAPAVSNKGQLTYTPAAGAGGEATIGLVLMDSGGTTNGGVDASATQFFKISLEPVNAPPSFTPGPDQTVLEDAGTQTVAGWATGISPGPPSEAGQSLTFRVANNTNPGLFSTPPAISPSGQLTYTSAPNANGFAKITVELMDDGGTDKGGLDTSAPHIFEIAVTPVNDPPSFTKGANRTVLEDAGAQNIAGWATAIVAGPADEAGQTTSFNVTNNTNSALFSTAPAISSTGQLTFTPAPNANGTATITVRLTDSGGTANGGVDTSVAQTFVINVTPINDVPSFTKGADQTSSEDSARTVPGWATAISAGAGDESGQTLTFNVTNNTNSALFSTAPAISAAGQLTYTPAANASGTATITVALMDNGGTANGGVDTSATQTFQINITPVNDAPTFTKGANQTLLENAGAQIVPGWATNISAGPVDESGQTLTFNITENTNPALFAAGPVISVDGQLTYTPVAGANGTATITVQLIDNGGTANGGVDTSAAQTFQIAITPVNAAPTFTKGVNQAVLEDAGPQGVAGWATAINAGRPSESGQTLTFNVTGNTNPGLFSVAPAISRAGRLTFTPAANANGSATITVVLMDNGGTANGGADTSAPQSFVMTVRPINDVPSFTKGANQTVLAGAGPQTVPGWATAISAGPADESGQALTFNVTGNTNPAAFLVAPEISASGQLAYTPAADANGAATITVELMDDGGTANGGVDTSAAQTFVIAFTPVNAAPSFTKGADQIVLEDAGLQTVNGWATGISAGPAGESSQSLTFNVTGNTNPSLFAVAPSISADGRLRYAPAANARGSAMVTVELMDDGGAANGGADTSAPQTFAITITPVNDVPSFTRGPDQIVDEDSGAQIVPGWASAISAGPADESGQTLTFRVTGNTNPALFSAGPTISSSGRLTYTPALNASGAASVTVVLMDNGGTADGGVDTSAAQTIAFAVRPVNDAPEISSISDVLIPLGALSPAIPFTINDVETAADVLEVTATSNDQTVIPDANISLAGSGSNRTITIAPLPSQTGGPVVITVVVSDGDASNSETFLATVVDTTAPVVVGTKRNNDNGRFDQLTSLSFSFSEDIGDTLNPNDLSLINVNSGARINLFGAAVSWNPATMTARWDLSQIPLDVANYSAVLSANGIRDVDGNPLDGDGDGTGGGDFVASHPLTFTGDANLNFAVDFTDFLALSGNFGLADRGWPGADFNGSGTTDFTDFLALAANFGRELEPVAAVAEPPEVPGDANLDGNVDFADFLIVSANFGERDRSWTEGDFTGDGQVQFDDYLILAEAFRIDAPAPTSPVSDAFAEDEEGEPDWWLTDESDDALTLTTRIGGALD